MHELHEGHQGVVKMKALARSYVWWPNIDRDVEQLKEACFECLQNALILRQFCILDIDLINRENESILILLAHF